MIKEGDKILAGNNRYYEVKEIIKKVFSRLKQGFDLHKSTLENRTLEKELVHFTDYYVTVKDEEFNFNRIFVYTEREFFDIKTI